MRHGMLVAVPLAVVTVFCFGFVMMQPGSLKNPSSRARGETPPLNSGAKAKIKPPSDQPIQTLQIEGSPSSQTGPISSSRPQTSSANASSTIQAAPQRNEGATNSQNDNQQSIINLSKPVKKTLDVVSGALGF